MASKTTTPALLKAAIGALIAAEIDRRGITQAETSNLIKESPSQISLVYCGHLRGFSLERLLAMATKLGLSFDVRASATARAGRITFQKSAQFVRS